MPLKSDIWSEFKNPELSYFDELDPATLWVPNIKPKQLNTSSPHFAAQFHLYVFFFRGLCGHFYGGVRLEALCVAWKLLGSGPSGVWNSSRGNLGIRKSVDERFSFTKHGKIGQEAGWRYIADFIGFSSYL